MLAAVAGRSVDECSPTSTSPCGPGCWPRSALPRAPPLRPRGGARRDLRRSRAEPAEALHERTAEAWEDSVGVDDRPPAWLPATGCARRQFGRPSCAGRRSGRGARRRPPAAPSLSTRQHASSEWPTRLWSAPARTTLERAALLLDLGRPPSSGPAVSQRRWSRRRRRRPGAGVGAGRSSRRGGTGRARRRPARVHGDPGGLVRTGTGASEHRGENGPPLPAALPARLSTLSDAGRLGPVPNGRWKRWPWPRSAATPTRWSTRCAPASRAHPTRCPPPNGCDWAGSPSSRPRRSRTRRRPRSGRTGCGSTRRWRSGI